MTGRTSTPRRGRPPLAWLTLEALRALPLGTAVSVETHGRHNPRTVGRLTRVTETTVEVASTRGPARLDNMRIRRARLLPSVYEPGDPVLRRNIPAGQWRGGVVRTDGTDVLVEQIGGTFAWFHEDKLEPPEVRDIHPPIVPRGPVPAGSPR